MTTSPIKVGASVAAQNRTPSLDLATTVTLLAQAIPASATEGLSALPFVSLEANKIRVNTRAVLNRFMHAPGFSSAFDPGEQTGFVRDLVMPPNGMTAKVGGRLVSGTQSALSAQLEKLRAAVSAELSTSIGDKPLVDLTVESLEATLREMADTASIQVPHLPKSASMVQVQFEPAGRKVVDREKDLARLLTAMETIDGEDWLEPLLRGIHRQLAKEGLDLDEIQALEATIRKQRNRPGSQVASFLEFLEDEALARVRMQVSMRLMEAVAVQSKKNGLKAYVERVRQAFELFAGVDGRSLLLDVSRVLGVHNSVDLADELRKSMFYNCLAVWAEWSVQLFERRADPALKKATVREVSYRFRVNGQNSMSGKSAFDTRLESLHEHLVSDPDPARRLGYRIAQLVFLHLVVPDSISAPGEVDVLAAANDVAARLKADPLGTAKELHESLKSRSGVMEDLADELVAVLRDKSTSLVDAANRRVDTFMVFVLRSVIRWEVLSTLSSPNTDWLVSTEGGGSDRIAWFKHLQVGERLNLAASVASLSVATELQERSLGPTGGTHEVHMERDLSARTLPVRMVPFFWAKGDGTWLPDVPNESFFDAGAGIDIEYEVRNLKLSEVDPKQKARAQQRRSATVAAFTLLVYTVLFEVVRRLKADAVADPSVAKPLAMTILRMQHAGRRRNREDDANDGNTAAYAASQAIERALSRELPVKLQGIATNDGKRADQERFAKTGSLAALLGGQPMRFRMEGTLDKIAILTYITKPSDSHPLFSDAQGQLFISRTYLAERAADGSATLRVDRMLSRLVDSVKDFKTPHAILEEVARLEREGFTHIALLSHHFGNRHIGRAAERHSPHATNEFLDGAAKRFPGVHLYPLRRDIFPATRLRRRTSMESGFEVTNFEDHRKMYSDGAADVLRSLLPIYTFATLAVVSEELRPQSGFCTYFFDLETRVEHTELNESVRRNMLGFEAGKGPKESITSLLRAVHFLESEKPANKAQLLPVLDPFEWATPQSTAASGEVEIMNSRRQGTVYLSLPSVLAHATRVFHKEAL
jgi:Skp family chaperone for outer membrane proteins